MVSIVQATTQAELDDVRALILAFVDWARLRLADDIERVNRYFHPSLFDPELAGLPGRYAPPKGSLLVAYADGKAAG